MSCKKRDSKYNKCKKKIFLSGFCRYHYNMNRIKINQKTKSCTVDNCKKKYYINGMCMMHYKRLRPEISIGTRILDHAEPVQVMLMAVIKVYTDDIIELELRRTVTKDKKVRQQNLNAKDATMLNEALCFLFDGDELAVFCDFAGFNEMRIEDIRKYLMEYISEHIYEKRNY